MLILAAPSGERLILFGEQRQGYGVAAMDFYAFAPLEAGEVLTDPEERTWRLRDSVEAGLTCPAIDALLTGEDQPVKVLEVERVYEPRAEA